MLKMIKVLLESGNAYLSDGHVLFSVSSMPNYGKLSGMNLSEMIDGARVEVSDYKKEPADFVLCSVKNRRTRLAFRFWIW